MNLRQQLDQYTASLRASGRSSKTVRSYKERIDQFITYLSETFYPLNAAYDIDLDHIQQYHDHLITNELSVSTRRTYLATIRGFLQWHQPAWECRGGYRVFCLHFLSGRERNEADQATQRDNQTGRPR